jgi:hypothetical protein
VLQPPSSSHSIPVAMVFAGCMGLALVIID